MRSDNLVGWRIFRRYVHVLVILILLQALKIFPRQDISKVRLCRRAAIGVYARFDGNGLKWRAEITLKFTRIANVARRRRCN
jgi:hypothetical protein